MLFLLRENCFSSDVFFAPLPSFYFDRYTANVRLFNKLLYQTML